MGEAARGSAEIAENISSVAQAAASTTDGAANVRRSAAELGHVAEALGALVGQARSHHAAQRPAVNGNPGAAMGPARVASDGIWPGERLSRI